MCHTLVAKLSQTFFPTPACKARQLLLPSGSSRSRTTASTASLSAGCASMTLISSCDLVLQSKHRCAHFLQLSLKFWFGDFSDSHNTCSKSFKLPQAVEKLMAFGLKPFRCTATAAPNHVCNICCVRCSGHRLLWSTSGWSQFWKVCRSWKVTNFGTSSTLTST